MGRGGRQPRFIQGSVAHPRAPVVFWVNNEVPTLNVNGEAPDKLVE